MVATPEWLGRIDRRRRFGRGNHRIVHPHPDHLNLVVKLPHCPAGRVANLLEARRWRELHGLRRWLAPVLACCPQGHWLVMARAEPIDKVPAAPAGILAMGDVARASNWGLYRGRPVVRDYGHVSMTARVPRRAASGF